MERPFLRYKPRYRAIICLKCESAYPMSRIADHFLKYHHYPIHIYRSLLHSFKGGALAEDWKDLKYPTGYRLDGTNRGFEDHVWLCLYGMRSQNDE